MKTVTQIEVLRILQASAAFDYSDPKWASAEICAVADRPNRFVVIGRCAQGERVYGAIAGRWAVQPIMTRVKAAAVLAYLCP